MPEPEQRRCYEELEEHRRGELHATSRVQICSDDGHMTHDDCVPDTRRVDVTVKAVEGGSLDLIHTFEPRWLGCADYCVSEVRVNESRAVIGTLTVDGQVTPEVTGCIGSFVGVSHMLIRPALAPGQLTR